MERSLSGLVGKDEVCFSLRLWQHAPVTNDHIAIPVDITYVMDKETAQIISVITVGNLSKFDPVYNNAIHSITLPI